MNEQIVDITNNDIRIPFQFFCSSSFGGNSCTKNKFQSGIIQEKIKNQKKKITSLSPGGESRRISPIVGRLIVHERDPDLSSR